MTDFDFSRLVSPEQHEAFADMWPAQSEFAKGEMRWILDLLSSPSSQRTEYEELQSKLVIALIGAEPDLSAWMQAIAGGGFELRPEQRYALPGFKERPARFISRGLATYDDGTSRVQRHLGITDASARDGINLVAISSVLKEFRNLVTGPRALGPAWPVFVSVDNHLNNQEHRQLYRYGSDGGLQEQLATAIRSTLQTFVSEQEDAAEPVLESRAADWRRKMPPGADPQTYFGRGSAALERYRHDLGAALNVTMTAQPDLAQDVNVIKDSMVQLVPAQSIFSYFILPDGTKREWIEYTSEERERIRDLMPLLTRSNVDDLMRAAGVRAAVRRYWSRLMLPGHPKALIAEVEKWVGLGFSPPPDLRIEHAHLFEEEACCLYFENPDKLEHWREMLGLFPDKAPDPSMDPLKWIDEHTTTLLKVQRSRIE